MTRKLKQDPPTVLTQETWDRALEIRNAFSPTSQQAEPLPNAINFHDAVPKKRSRKAKGKQVPSCNETDLGNARKLVETQGHNLRYCHPWKSWLVWDSKRLRPDNTGAARRTAQETADQLYRVAMGKEDDVLLKHAIATATTPRLSAMLQEASCIPGIPITPDDFDRDVMLLNCENGTLDLRTKTLRPHTRGDLLTKLCPVNYVPDAVCPTWERFLETVFANRRELIEFMRRLLGYYITGDVREQILAIFCGCGANGKSTLFSALLDVLGPDYAMKAAPDLLMSKDRDSHPTERADLFGMRFAACIESGSGRGLDETLVKEITGGDKVRARKMRQDFFEFSPTHKVALGTNHKPRIRGNDHGIWRRLALIPFDVVFWNPDKGETGPEELKQDKSLPEKLRAEREGILRWCVDGCLEWQARGLDIPEVVRAATAQYRSAEDVLAAFIEDCCFTAQGVKEKASNLYATFVTWCERSGENKVSQRVFGERLGDRGYDSFVSNGTWYRGIALKADSVGEVGNEF